MENKRRKIFGRIVLAIFLVLLFTLGTLGFLFWKAVYKNNISPHAGDLSYLYIHTGSDYSDLLQNLKSNHLLQNYNTFEWLAKRKNLPSHVYPGRYSIKAGMNNDELIDMLRSGAQTPVDVTFNNLRTLSQLATVIAKQIEADSTSIINYIHSSEFEEKYSLDRQTAPLLFIPNTYEFYWNTSAEAFTARMHKEYLRFWDEEKQAKARQYNLSPKQVSILASIVDKETNRNDEKPTIAGVYLNRLKKGWKLQADPTAVFAFYLENDSLLHRVYKKHTQIDSPYNTYVHAGLPPGPICLPSLAGINAVLNAQKHQYMFFVAKGDGSGYHHFSQSYSQHLKYAREHYRALNNKKQ